MAKDEFAVDASRLTFPVTPWHPECMEVCSSADPSTHVTQAAVRRRWFTKAKVIDSSGRRYTLSGARILHGLRLYGGWGIFLDRDVRVALLTREEPCEITQKEFKGLADQAMPGDPDWGGLSEYWQVARAVKGAATVGEALAATNIGG
ncbi:MAG TPA: hypothetical protein VGM37_03585 [Armatimonadota bacterium]|jgi:hypothetical protein